MSLLARWALASAALLLALGCSTESDSFQNGRGMDAGADARVSVPDAGADAGRVAVPTLVAVTPSHGSFLGGTEVTLRGTNFSESTIVRFGDAMVQPRYTRFVDRNRIVVLTPAGRPGAVDVGVEEAGRRGTLPMAYTYDAVYLDPQQGPTTGGARVTIHGSGTRFADGMEVRFDDLPCTMLQVTSPELASCLTPAHPDGRVAVTVRSGEQTVTLEDAYLYSDTVDDVGGGLGGGALNGSITVTVLNAQTGDAVPEAFVFLGNDPGAVPPWAGRTNMRGQVTLAPQGLTAPATVSASKHCFTSATIQSFNARAATIYLRPLMLPECGMGMGGGMGQRPLLASRLYGELVWEGSNEFAPNPWDNIPPPRMGEVRVAYVYASRPDIFTADPDAMVAAQFQARVTETVREGYGGRGYPFQFQARPAAVAVYALAGIENMTTRRFQPYIMGVARGVLGAPGATIEGISVPMNIPLDHVTPMVAEAFAPDRTGLPNTFHGSVFIDLGGEGVIPLPHLSVTRRVGGMSEERYEFAGLPAFAGALSDARLTVHARLASGPITGPGTFVNTPAPCTALVVSGITTPDQTVRVRNWLGIPDITSPMAGGQLPTDRTVRFNVDAGSPDLLLLTLQWQASSWNHYAPGMDRAIQYPDLSTVMGLSDVPRGEAMTLSLVGVRIPDFQFNRFTYATIGPAYWTAYAGRGVLITR